MALTRVSPGNRGAVPSATAAAAAAVIAADAPRSDARASSIPRR